MIFLPQPTKSPTDYLKLGTQPTLREVAFAMFF